MSAEVSRCEGQVLDGAGVCSLPSKIIGAVRPLMAQCVHAGPCSSSLLLWAWCLALIPWCWEINIQILHMHVPSAHECGYHKRWPLPKPTAASSRDHERVIRALTKHSCAGSGKQKRMRCVKLGRDSFMEATGSSSAHHTSCRPAGASAAARSSLRSSLQTARLTRAVAPTSWRSLHSRLRSYLSLP